MTKVGNVIAIALESPYEEGLPDGLVLFVDVSDPTSPSILNHFEPVEAGEKLGTIGIMENADGTYLMVVTGGDSAILCSYRGAPIAPGLSAPLGSSNLGWTLIETWESLTGFHLEEQGPAPITAPNTHQ